MPTLATDVRARLSLLWVFVMLNMIFADILSFMGAGVLKEILEGRAGQIELTAGFLLLAAVMTEIPIAMVLLNLVLPMRALRWTNLAAAAFTAAYVLGMGSMTTPHYIFIAGIETLACVLIAWTAWKLRAPAEEARTGALVTE